jgi:hypothetical protein
MAKIARERLDNIGVELSNYASSLAKYLNSWQRPDQYRRVEGWSDPVQGTYSNRRKELWFNFSVPCGKLLVEAMKAGAFLLEEPKFRQRLLSHFGSLRQRHQEWFAAGKTFEYGAVFLWRRNTRSFRRFKEETNLWAETFPYFIQSLIEAVGPHPAARPPYSRR